MSLHLSIVLNSAGKQNMLSHCSFVSGIDVKLFAMRLKVVAQTTNAFCHAWAGGQSSCVHHTMSNFHSTGTQIHKRKCNAQANYMIIHHERTLSFMIEGQHAMWLRKCAAVSLALTLCFSNSQRSSQYICHTNPAMTICTSTALRKPMASWRLAQMISFMTVLPHKWFCEAKHNVHWVINFYPKHPTWDVDGLLLRSLRLCFKAWSWSRSARQYASSSVLVPCSASSSSAFW